MKEMSNNKTLKELAKRVRGLDDVGMHDPRVCEVCKIASTLEALTKSESRQMKARRGSYLPPPKGQIWKGIEDTLVAGHVVLSDMVAKAETQMKELRAEVEEKRSMAHTMSMVNGNADEFIYDWFLTRIDRFTAKPFYVGGIEMTMGKAKSEAKEK